MSSENPSGRSDRLWKICFGASALLACVGVWGGIVASRDGPTSAVAIFFVGAGVIFALLGTSLRTGR